MVNVICKATMANYSLNSSKLTIYWTYFIVTAAGIFSHSCLW